MRPRSSQRAHGDVGARLGRLQEAARATGAVVVEFVVEGAVESPLIEAVGADGDSFVCFVLCMLLRMLLPPSASAHLDAMRGQLQISMHCRHCITIGDWQHWCFLTAN